MNGWTVGWITWLTLTIGSFLALEIPAIIRKNNSEKDPDTLSDHLALWFRVNTWKGRWIWTGVISAIGAIVVWLGLHIITGQAV
jgi:hypothetical protein